MKTYGVDWGHGVKTCYHGEDGPVPWKKKSLAEFIEAHAPCRIVIESTFHSFYGEEKNRTIDLAEALGCVLVTVSPRTTANYRTRLGVVKSDPTDAEVIYRIWKDGKVHLTQPKRSPVKERTPLEEVELMRHRKWPKQDIKKFLQYLPPLKDIPEKVLNALGEVKPGKLGKTGKVGKERRALSTSIAVPMIAAALQSKDRHEFERTVGSYGSAYPGFVRSNFYYHRLDSLVKRKRTDKTKAAHKLKSQLYKQGRLDEYRALTSQLDIDERAALKQCMKELRRASRWVYHKVKERA